MTVADLSLEPGAPKKTRGMDSMRSVRKERTWVVLVGAFAAVQVAAAAALNLVADPRSEFGTDWFAPVVEDDVRIKLDLFSSYGGPLDTLVLGSSRVMTLNPNHVDGLGRGFNFALLPSTPQDELLVLRFVLDSGAQPQRVVVGIELDAFQGDREVRWQLRTAPEFAAYVDAPTWMDRLARLGDSLTQAYLQDSLRVLRHAAGGAPPGANAFAPDGVVHRVEEASVEAGTYDIGQVLTLPHLADLAQRVAGFGPPASAQLDALGELVRLAGIRGASVHLVLTPVFPEVLERLDRDAAYASQLEALVAALATLCGAGVHLHDFTRAESFGGRAADFIDETHYVGGTATRLLAAVRDQVADACTP